MESHSSPPLGSRITYTEAMEPFSCKQPGHRSSSDALDSAANLVAFAEQENGVLIRRKRSAGSDEKLSPEDAKIVRRGEAQLRRGESKPWRAVMLPR
jgi:hypothetical protein